MISEIITTLVLGGIPLGVGYALGRKNQVYKENEGERNVRKVLESLNENDYHIKNNITIPTIDGSTQIDHIAFSRKGIFVIETKNHKGWIFGGEKQKEWTQTFSRSRNKYKFHNPITQNIGHVKHIERITGIPSDLIRSIIVFSNPDVEIKTDLPGNVVRLNKLKNYISQFELNMINDDKLYEAIGKLEFSRKKRSNRVDEEHIEYIQGKFDKNRPKMR